MTDRLFSHCCYGCECQHLPNEPCPQERARLSLANTLDLAGYADDAEHLRKPIRVGDVMVPSAVAMAAMMSFAARSTPPQAMPVSEGAATRLVERERCAKVADEDARTSREMYEAAAKDGDRVGLLVHAEAQSIAVQIAAALRETNDVG